MKYKPVERINQALALETLLQIKNTSGSKAKLELLESQKENELLKDLLKFALDPYIRTGIGQSKLNKKIDQTGIKDYAFVEGVIEYLKQNNTGKDKDIAQVQNFIDHQDPEYREIWEMIFTKSLNIGISEKTVNKVWPDLIPSFGIQLAHRLEDYMDFLEGKLIFLTEKLDGNRCFAQVKDHVCTFYARSGRIIEGLDEVGNELSRLTDGWYDGELIADSFQETQSMARRKGKKKDLVFNIFDYLLEGEVQDQKCIHNYRQRRLLLNRIFMGIESWKHVKLVPVIAEGIYDYNWVMEILDDYTSRGSEGIMINLDKPYEFKRTENLIKVKKMYTQDLRVIRIEEGQGQNQNKLGNVIVDYKGYEVGVGSGFKKEEREYYWEHPEEIIGKVIEVKAFEETTNQEGELSLRFPVFIRIRNDKDEVSYD